VTVSKLYVHFDGGSKQSLYCILRDHWKNLRTVLFSQNTLKTLGPAPALCIAASIESVNLCWLVGVARGPIRRNRSNRLEAEPSYNYDKRSAPKRLNSFNGDF